MEKDQSQCNKTFMVNVIRYLDKQLDSDDFCLDKKELILVAKQCLDAAFSIAVTDYTDSPEINLLEYIQNIERTLAEVVKKNLISKSKTVAHISTETIEQYSTIKSNPSFRTEKDKYSSDFVWYTKMMSNEKEKFPKTSPESCTYNRLGILNLCLHKWKDAVKCFTCAIINNPVYKLHHRMRTCQTKTKRLSKIPPPLPPIPLEFYEAPKTSACPPPLPPVDFDITSSGSPVPIRAASRFSRFANSDEDENNKY